MARTVHIIGGGLAGLSAAVDLAGRGFRPVVHEATGQAGGRCRSYDDAQSGMRIDNGTHILLSGNTAALGFIERIGAKALVSRAARARFAFTDLARKRAFTLDLGSGRLPLWMFDPARRAPDTAGRDYLALAAPLVRRRPGEALGKVVACTGPAFEQVLRPLLLAALNTEPSEAACDLVRAVVKGSIARGGAACRPCLMPRGLGATLVEPATAYVEKNGGVLHFGHELRRCIGDGERVTALEFTGGAVALGAQDAVVLAVPPHAAGAIVPSLEVPDAFRAIVNAHFRFVPPRGLEPMVGILNGTAEWIFFFDDRICATISGADRLMRYGKDALARMIWQDVVAVAGIQADLPPWQVVRERRATFAATPAQNARRPGPGTRWRNLALAGDWTDTGLPGTIESAVRSGARAAAFLMQSCLR